MKNTNDGGPAFPNTGGNDSGLFSCYGMSLREWYAGMALNGLLAKLGDTDHHLRRHLVAIAFDYADNMIRHEEDEQGEGE